MDASVSSASELASTSPRRDEIALLDQARQGDRNALGALLRKHRSAIERLCRRMCSDPSQLDDVLQETYVAILRNVRSFRGDSGFLTWVYTIARTHRGRAIRTAARERARRELLERWGGAMARPLPELDDEISTREISDALLRALEPLSGLDREIVVMRDVEGHTAAEIAEAVGLTIPAVKTRLHRARVVVRARLLELRPAMQTAA